MVNARKKNQSFLLTKPISPDYIVLNLSKVKILDFYYNYTHHAKLFFTATDRAYMWRDLERQVTARSNWTLTRF